jgi:ABC-2 type transport system permease protein
MTALTASSPPLSRLTTVELRKLADTRAGLWLLLSTVLVAVGITALVVAVGEPRDQALDGLVEATTGLTSVLLPIIGILAVTGEFSQRTALMTFTLVPRRERIVAAKLLAGVLFALAVSAACVAVAAIGTALSGGEWSLSAGALAGPVLDQVLGVLKGTALGLAVMISPLAIVLFFTLPIAIGVLTETVGALEGIGGWVNGSVTFAGLLDGDLGGADWGRLTVSVAVWLGIPLAIGLVRLRRRELA